MRALRSAPIATLALTVCCTLMVACSSRSTPKDGPSDAATPDGPGLRADLRADALVKTYPWVSTYLGPGGCGADVHGHRLTVKLPQEPRLTTFTDLQGTLLFIATSRLLYVEGDELKVLIDEPAWKATTYDKIVFPAKAKETGFHAAGVSVAAASADRIYLGLGLGIVVMEQGVLRLLAGRAEGSLGYGTIVDGKGAAAKFGRITRMVATGPKELVIADLYTLRRVVGDEVTTIAGSGEVIGWNPPKDGDALTEATLEIGAFAVLPDRILIFGFGWLRELRHGRVTTLGGKYWKDRDPELRQDGPVKDATFGWVEGVKVIGSDVYFIDRDKQHTRALRRLRGGVVTTLGPLRTHTSYQDGPFAKAGFESNAILVRGGGDRLFIYGGDCRVREIELD